MLPITVLPNKEIYLEDKNKSLSYPGDMHDIDVQHHININEYGKSPRQSIMQILAQAEPIISDENWFAMEKKAKETIKAVPEFVKGVGQSMAQDVKDAGSFLMTGKIDTEARLKANRAVVDPGLKLADAAFETLVGRIYEPVRAFVGDVVTGQTDELGADVIKAVVMPSSVVKITAHDRIPFTQKEREGGIAALIPRAVAGAIEDLFIYGGLQSIPVMIENYQINAARNLLRNSTAKIHSTVMEKMNMNAEEAWAYMQRPEVQAYFFQRADKYLKSPKLYTGVPAPNDPKAAIKAVGETAGKAATDPVTVAKAAAGETIKPGYKERKFITSIKEELPILKVSGQYVPRSTDELAQKARTLIQEDLALAETMARTGTDDASIATGAELLKHYTELAEKATEPAVADALYERAAELGNDMAVRLTELGRSVQAASILSRQTPEGQIKFAAQTIKRYNAEVEKDAGMFGLRKKIPELTGEQARFIRDRVTAISQLPDGEAKAVAWKEMQDYLNDLVPTPLLKKITTVWKAGLLTGIKTSGLNIFSNASHAFGTEVLKDIPAVAVDSVVSLFTGKRAVAFTTRGLSSGIKEGFEKGWRFLKTGYDERNVLGKFDYRRVSFGKGKIAKGLQAYEEGVFKILGAEDQIFYYGAKARSIAEQAIVAAKNKGLKGKEAETYINNLIENPTDDTLVLAVSDAEAATFQNETFLSKAGRAIQNIPGGEFVLPFSKTPSAVAMQIINYSPAGVIKTALENIGKGKWDQRDFSKGMGRALLGVPLLWFGYDLYNRGDLTLDRPISERLKELAKLENRKANSIKIGDTWRSIQVLGPAGNLILIGGQFAKRLQESGSPTEAISKTIFGSAKSFSEQTFLKGMSSAIDALTDPERSAEYFTSGLISSFVPTIIADIAKATDKTERRVENISNAIASRIPFLRSSLEPQIDVLGRERIIPENFFEIMADPTRPMTEIKDPIVQELRRLTDLGFEISTTLLGGREGYDILTPEQNTELWQNAGAIAFDKISSYMQMDSYEDTDDELKAKNIDKILDKAKVSARVGMVLEITEGLEGEELLNKLSEAKKSGLLNLEVLELYKRIR